VVQIVVNNIGYYYTDTVRYFMNTSIGDVVRTDIPIELERRPIWPAFVIAVAIAATFLWTGTVGWLLFWRTAFLIT
jgi:hypothetical protein